MNLSKSFHIVPSAHRLNDPAPLSPWQPSGRPNLLQFNSNAAAQSPNPARQIPSPGLPCSCQPQTKDKLAKARQGAGSH